ncbi:Uncharacterised protein [Vibrio cholerae]|nr:Uncharacterised protein [Vibrio cholerae]CSB98681.1 Uncharacterised protein [Vibrio cholerae]CSC20033.1 Uncharacterised protein [Vibrio cholerae]CSD08720.1 Uncharacterised protein [Vibrio cholerae]
MPAFIVKSALRINGRRLWLFAAVSLLYGAMQSTKTDLVHFS